MTLVLNTTHLVWKLTLFSFYLCSTYIQRVGVGLVACFLSFCDRQYSYFPSLPKEKGENMIKQKKDQCISIVPSLSLKLNCLVMPPSKLVPEVCKGDLRTQFILILAWAQIGSILVFPAIKITMVHQVHKYCGLRVESKMPYGVQRLWMRCLLFFLRVVKKNKYPQFEPHGWWCHYTGWYTRSGISLVN